MLVVCLPDWTAESIVGCISVRLASWQDCWLYVCQIGQLTAFLVVNIGCMPTRLDNWEYCWLYVCQIGQLTAFLVVNVGCMPARLDSWEYCWLYVCQIGQLTVLLVVCPPDCPAGSTICQMCARLVSRKYYWLDFRLIDMPKAVLPRCQLGY
jgi:hypothetical protein